MAPPGLPLLLLSLLAVVNAQIPSLGWCPDYQPMAKFNMNRFLGQWHEAERYFTVTELGSRCVTTTYEKMPDGRVWVSNEIRNTFTGVKRVLDGQLQVVGRDGEGKLSVKYTSLPVPYDTQYSVLDTDYDNYAVIWSCSGIGPVHTQNAWVMTRERLAPGLVLQRAYGVLDKYKISRAFFVKTNQADCTVSPDPIPAVDPKPSPVAVPPAAPAPAAPAPGSAPAASPAAKSAPVDLPAEPIVAEKAEAVPLAKSEEVIPKKEEAVPVASSAPISIPELILSTAEPQKPSNDDAKPSEKPADAEVPQADAPVSAPIPEAAPGILVSTTVQEGVKAALESKHLVDIELPKEAEAVKPELKKGDHKKVEKHVEHKNIKPIAEISKVEP